MSIECRLNPASVRCDGGRGGGVGGEGECAAPLGSVTYVLDHNVICSNRRNKLQGKRQACQRVQGVGVAVGGSHALCLWVEQWGCVCIARKRNTSHRSTMLGLKMKTLIRYVCVCVCVCVFQP